MLRTQGFDCYGRLSINFIVTGNCCHVRNNDTTIPNTRSIRNINTAIIIIPLFRFKLPSTPSDQTQGSCWAGMHLKTDTQAIKHGSSGGPACRTKWILLWPQWVISKTMPLTTTSRTTDTTGDHALDNYFC